MNLVLYQFLLIDRFVNYQGETMERNMVFDIILSLVENSNRKKKGERLIVSNFEGKEYVLNNTDYLLNQVLRQYTINPDHYLISKQAKNLWNQIGDGRDISNFYYQEKVICRNDNVSVEKFKGASNKGDFALLEKGKNFTYKDVFHNDHIIPLKMIIDKLNELKRDKKLNYYTLKKVLDNIYICRITKREDRDLKNKTKRHFNIHECYERIYKPKGIIIETLEK